MNRKHSIAEQLSSAELIMAGLATHGERLAKRGLDSDFLTRLTACHRGMTDNYAAQQEYKALWMGKTEARRTFQNELQDLCGEARKMIKAELPREAWRQFGIVDQR
jgi:hypothetical protein